MANAITLLRVLLVPFVIFTLSTADQTLNFIAAIILLVGSLSDAIDGYLARHRGEVSDIGKFLDPMADKIFVMAGLIMLLHLGRVPAWLVIVMLGREFMISSLRSMASARGQVIAAAPLGKIKAALQMTALICLALYQNIFGIPVIQLGIIVLYASLVLAIVSAIDYSYKFFSSSHS